MRRHLPSLALELEVRGGMSEKVVVFLCKGTRGDVQPLLALATTFKECHAKHRVVFACPPSSLHGVRVPCHLDFKPLPDPATPPLPDPATPPLPDPETAQGLASDAARLAALSAEAAVCLGASAGASLVVFNLFTLEGYFIARHLKVPCLAASPHLLNRTPPVKFESHLAKTHPILHHQLKSALPGVVSYAEVDHWMWRLFLNDFGEVCEGLSLPQLPFVPNELPAPTPLLYGVSPTVFPRPQYWPESVELCGYWIPPANLQLSPDPSLVTLIEGISSPLLYVGFGSMESYMVDVAWPHFLATLQEALESTAMEALVQCSPTGAVASGHASLPRPLPRVHVWRGTLPHPWLFPRCSVVLHHGGAGTAASALLARRPQIISPVMFDQHSWAERLQWAGLAHQCPHARQLGVRDLTHALRVTAGAAMMGRVAGVAAALVREDGLARAVGRMEQLLWPGSPDK